MYATFAYYHIFQHKNGYKKTNIVNKKGYKKMKKSDNRAVEFAEYILKNKATIRQTATAFKVSKSTVHSDVSYKLCKINFILFLQVKSVLFSNFKFKGLKKQAKNKLEFLKY